MKRRTTYLALAAALTLAAISCKHGIMQGGITVKGDITGYGGTTVYAAYENPEKGIVTDTARVKSGKFTIKAESAQETPLYITDENGRLITALFVKDNDNITVSGEFSPYRSKISGNPANTLLGGFYNGNASILAALDSLRNLYVADHGDSAYCARLAATTDSVSRLAGAFVKANPTSPASIFLIYRYVSRYDNRNETRQLTESTTSEARPERFTAKIERYVSAQRYDKEKVMPYTQLHTPNDSAIYSFSRKNLPTVVCFWSVKDTASMRITDTLRTLYRNIPEKKVQIHSVSLDIDKNAWKRVIRSQTLPWSHSILPEGWNSQTAYLLNLSKLPTLFFIESNGTIIGRDLKTDSLRTLIEQKLK